MSKEKILNDFFRLTAEMDKNTKERKVKEELKKRIDSAAMTTSILEEIARINNAGKK